MSTSILDIHAYVGVSDPKQGLTFYCGGLGLSLKKQLSPRRLKLEGAGTPIYLLGNHPEIADLGSTSATRDFERHWMPVHLDFIVTFLNDMVDQFLGHSTALDRAIKEREHGRISNMADPFSKGFDLIEFFGNGYTAVSRSVQIGRLE